MDLFNNISASSKKLYLHNLKKLNNNQEIKNLNFLKNTESILEEINSKKDNTKRTYLISIVSALKESNSKPHKKLYDFYYPYLEELNKSLKDNTSMKEKEIENWITEEELKEITDKCDEILEEIKGKRKLTPEQYDKLLNCLILSLFTKTPPRRNLDYIEMIVDVPQENKTTNYYHKGKFYFNRFKTQKTYQQQVIDVPSNLDEIIKLYLKHKPNETKDFLVRYDHRPLKTSTDMTRILNKIFDKKISASMLRKLYLTNKYEKVMGELEQDTKKMGTSVNTAKDNYIKDTME